MARKGKRRFDQLPVLHPDATGIDAAGKVDADRRGFTERAQTDTPFRS